MDDQSRKLRRLAEIVDLILSYCEDRANESERGYSSDLEAARLILSELEKS